MHFLRKIAFVTFLTPFAFIQADVEEVIVTANKKVETVQEIPMNISVITEVDIQERGISNPEDFLRTLAGCLLYTSPSPRDRTRSRMPSSA